MGRGRLTRIRARLREEYGTPSLPPHRAPLDELILTVLSQSTNDRNRDVAYLRLRDRFGGSWEAVRDAPVEAVEEAIRPGGISKVKSVRIQAMLEAVTARAEERAAGGATAGAEVRVGGGAAGGVTLDWLADLPVEEARAELTALPGVGRKTAACVLLFSFGARDVPVDTHVSRVGARLALLSPTQSFDRLHDEMLALTPRGAELELHVNLLRHGRRTCHAQRPACERCVLLRSCPAGRARTR